MLHDKDIFSRVQPYKSDETVLDGKCYKYFIRMNDNKNKYHKAFMSAIENNIAQRQNCECPKKTVEDSAIFGELWQNKINGNSSYVTYCDELFDQSTSGYYIPHFVSCLVKNNAVMSNYKECLGSRLSNLMGVPTVFNTMQAMVVSDGEARSLGFETNNLNLISVDFIPNGYEFESFEHLDLGINPDNSLESNLKIASSMWYYFISRSLGVKLDRKQVETFERDFCLQYLFRRGLCHEGDFRARNVGVLYSTELQKFYLAPNFDMEYLFVEKCTTLQQDMMYISKNFPGLVEGFVNRLRYVKENDLIKKTIDKLPRVSTYAFAGEVGIIQTILNNNIDEICNVYDNMSLGIST